MANKQLGEEMYIDLASSTMELEKITEEEDLYLINALSKDIADLKQKFNKTINTEMKVPYHRKMNRLIFLKCKLMYKRSKGTSVEIHYKNQLHVAYNRVKHLL